MRVGPRFLLLALDFFSSPIDQMLSPFERVARFLRCDTHDAVVGFVFGVYQPQERLGQLLGVRGRLFEQPGGSPVVVATMYSAEPTATDDVRRGDTGQDREAGRDT